MGLGLVTESNGGSRIPFVSYDAKAGRVFRVDRAQDAAGSWTSNKVDLTNNFVFVADLAKIKVGWLAFTDQGPLKQLVPLGTPFGIRPEGKKADGKPLYRQGFEFLILLSNAIGGPPAREFGSCAGCVIEAVDELHTRFEAAPESKQGKLPVVKLAGVIPVKSGQSNNYKPQFEIVSWVDRPAAFNDEQPAQVAAPLNGPIVTQPAITQPATFGTAPAPAPEPPPFVPNVPQPAPAAISASDFG